MLGTWFALCGYFTGIHHPRITRQFEIEVKVFLGLQVVLMWFGSQGLGHLSTHGAELMLDIKC